LKKINDQLSNWDKESWISRFNRSKRTDWIPIPDHAYVVLKLSIGLNKQTNGALDPTLGKLIDLWGFGPSSAEGSPDNQDIQSALSLSGVEKLTLRDHPARISKSDPGLQLNLSAVAKGYTVDLLAHKMKSVGITDFLIDMGGEIRSSGHPAHDSFWKVAIQRPDARSEQAYSTIKVNNLRLATSGDYRRFFKKDGQRYSHILNPKTGFPVQNNLASVTIIAPTTARADGIATACLVLGLQKALTMVEQIPGVEGYFIHRNGSHQLRGIATSGWPSKPSQNNSISNNKL